MIFFFSIIIGAPRSQSTLEVQRKINETGAIYKCNFENNSNGQCIPFVFDPWGNVHENYDQYSYNNEKKEFQWLGAAMDGSANDNDKFVVSMIYLLLSLRIFYVTADYVSNDCCFLLMCVNVCFSLGVCTTPNL